MVYHCVQSVELPGVQTKETGAYGLASIPIVMRPCAGAYA